MVALAVYEPDAEEDETEVRPTYPAAYRAALRDAGESFLRAMNSALAQIGSRLPQRHPCAVDYWAVCYATGSWLCSGVSITERSQMIGVEKATLSAATIQFCTGNGFPPSEYMRNDPETSEAYRQARLRSIAEENSRRG